MAEIETLLDAYVHGVRISMRCAWGSRDGLKSVRQCSYRVELDVETLLCTRGPSFPVAQLSQRLMCPRCRSRRVAVSLSFPAEPQASAAAGRAAHLSGRW